VSWAGIFNFNAKLHLENNNNVGLTIQNKVIQG